MTDIQDAPTDTSRRLLLEVARDLGKHGAAGTVPVADEIVEVPASRYTDPEYFEREKQLIFRRIPIMVAASCEIKNAGDHVSLEVAGIPVLVMRGRDGVARAFLNACTHRGAIIASERGSSLRLKCPYHGWNFDEKGALVGVPCRQEFGEITADLSLKQFPVLERGGLIWAILDPESKIDINTFLGDFGLLLEEFGFESWHVLGRSSYKGANWKLAFDAHLDFYHLPVLHRNTFGADVSPQAFYYHYGPHMRLARPGKRGGPATPTRADLFAQMEGPENDWTNEAMLLGEWILFPNVSFNSFYQGGRGVLISQILPGVNVDESVTVQTYIMENEPNDEDREAAEQLRAFLGDVVNGEDLPTSYAQQKALSTGMLKAVQFGRNEGGLQKFHKWSDRILESTDVELDRFLSAGNFLE
jgi:phenylpropionate dioxygenase-like ring-hydroxylating dioxygenase large terminal subunit